MERRTLAPVGVVGLQRRGGHGVLDDGVDPRPDLLHDAEVRVELLGDELLRRELSLVLLALLEVSHPAGQIVVVGLDRRATGGDLREPGPSGPGPARLVCPCRPLLVRRRPLVAHVDRRRCPLEHVQLVHHVGQLGDRLHRGGAGADDADPLALQGDVVVPARCVERGTLEALHPVDAGQLRARQDPVGEDHEPGTHGVTPIGGHRPAPGRLVPGRLLDGRVEEATLVEAEALGHLLAVLEDLEPGGELHRRDVAHLLQQRQVAVGLDVARDTRIAVPVPRPPDVAALLAEPHVGEPGLAQLVPQQQPREAGPDDQHLALVGQPRARHRLARVRVDQVAGELTLHRHVVGRPRRASL